MQNDTYTCQGETLKPQEDGIKKSGAEKSGISLKMHPACCKMSSKTFVRLDQQEEKSIEPVRARR
jgi:hypothetical protein